MLDDNPNEWYDNDGDGVGDYSDQFPDDASEDTDTDGDGSGDNADNDADGDGCPDDAIAAVAKANGFKMIIDVNSGALLYADETMDVTKLVKAKLGM